MADYFNAVERLEKFYGDIPEMEKAWIEDNIESLTDEQKGKFFKALTTSHEFKNGYPEISVMATVYKNHDWLTYPSGVFAKQISGKPLVIHVHATDFDRSRGNVNPTVYSIEKRGMDESALMSG